MRTKKIIFFVYILSVYKKMLLSHLLSWFWFSGSCKLAMVLDAKKTEAKKSVITYILYSGYTIYYSCLRDRNRSSSEVTERSVFPIDLACQEGLKTTQHPSSQTPLKLWCEPNSAGGFLLYTYAAMSATVYIGPVSNLDSLF